MKRWFVILLLFLLLAMGCYDNHSERVSDDIFEQANCKIGTLRSLSQGANSTILADLTCAGRVTSSDKDGNFYRSMIVEDESGAVEVNLGIYNIEAQYPIGLMVAIRLNGTAVMVEDGVVQLGLPPQSYDSAPRDMESQEVIDKHLIRSTSVLPVEPSVCDVESLDISMCGRFVKLYNLKHSPLEGYEEREYHRFVDENENAIFAYISSYADFYGLEIPCEQLTVQGILYYETVGMSIGRQFVIKPRFANDISISNNDI